MPTRPIYDQAVDPVLPFFTAFINFRPLIWDMVAYKGSVLAADMTGGFYSSLSRLRSSPPRMVSRSPSPPPAVHDRARSGRGCVQRPAGACASHCAAPVAPSQ